MEKKIDITVYTYPIKDSKTSLIFSNIEQLDIFIKKVGIRYVNAN